MFLTGLRITCPTGCLCHASAQPEFPNWPLNLKKSRLSLCHFASAIWPQLKVADLIDLQNTKLQSRYMEDSTAKPTMSTLHAHPTTAAPCKFTNEDWSKDIFLF